MTTPGIQLGLAGTAHTTVTQSNTAIALGSGLVPVFATPALVALLEEAAVKALAPQMEAGKTSVGTRVDVQHLAATPLGMAVHAEATVTGVDGRQISFRVTAYDEAEQIAEGIHQRIIVDEQRFLARAEAKALSKSG